MEAYQIHNISIYNIRLNSHGIMKYKPITLKRDESHFFNTPEEYRAFLKDISIQVREGHIRVEAIKQQGQGAKVYMGGASIPKKEDEVKEETVEAKSEEIDQKEEKADNSTEEKIDIEELKKEMKALQAEFSSSETSEERKKEIKVRVVELKKTIKANK